MTSSRKTFRIVLTILTGLLAFYKLGRQPEHENWLEIPWDFIIIILSATIFVWIIFKDTKEYLNTKKSSSFIPTSIGMFLLLGLLTTIYIHKKQDNSPSKFYCVLKIIDFNGASIDFKENGTYKLTNWCFGMADFYRGTYSMKDSIITLDKSNIAQIIVSNKLVVRPEIDIYEKDTIPGKDTVRQVSIYQIDKNGKIIGDEFIVRK